MEQDAPVFFSTPYPELNAILEQVYRHRGADGRGSLRQLSEVVDKLVEKWAAARAPAGGVTAPAGGVESEDMRRARHIAVIAQRWIGDRTGIGALLYLGDLAWALKTLSNPTSPAQAADSVLEDAARWNEVLMHVGAAYHLGGQHFTLNTLRIRDQMYLLRGSVAQHFTACIDDSRAARKQGGAT